MKTKTFKRRGFLTTGAIFSALLSLAACGKTDAEYASEVVTGMHDELLSGIDDLLAASKAMQVAAPATAGRGWDATQDKDALASLTAAWIQSRTAYEQIEGALAPLFPDVDFAIDARYDDVLAAEKPTGAYDTYLFDDQGFTGMHAVERILYQPTTPQQVIDFEATLTGSEPAARPATEQEAADFKNKLLAKLVSDVQGMRDAWSPQKIDVPGAFVGLIALMNEQKEKVEKASTNEEESRYSQRTMADIRDNLAGTKDIYAIFQPWILSKSNSKDDTQDGKKVNGAIEAGFSTVGALYDQVQGDAIPRPPPTFSTENPGADTTSPFGKLFNGVAAAVDPSAKGSVVDEMNDAAAMLGFSQFKE